MNPQSTRHLLPAGPFLAACLALVLSASLLFGDTAAWSIGTLYLCIAVRMILRARDWPLPSQALKLIILAAGFGAVLVSYGSILGIDAGLCILIILVALKLLETNTIRDFQVLVLLGYFLALCNLFFVQDLAHWLYIGLDVSILTGALICLYRPQNTARAIRTAFVMTVQALPIIILLYAFFPRTSGTLRGRFNAAVQGSKAMADRLEPGSIASLALRNDRAFRVQFPNGDMPPESQLYWRGVVLWRGEGLTWVPSGRLSVEHHNQLAGPTIHQQIILEPYGENWLFTLDHPAGNVPGSIYEPGSCLRSLRAIVFPLAYDVYSRPTNRETWLPPDQMFAATRKPTHVSSEVDALVNGWKADGADQRLVVRRALDYFRTNNFRYSLSPGSYVTNPLDDFLFHRRVGFCEHYAAAFATLMRVAGVPSRVVLGYLGGNFDGNLVTVRQSDAHAWCEVWFKGEGWERIDPTGVIAPERITGGMDSYLAGISTSNHSAAFTPGGQSSWRRWTEGSRLLWDNLSYQWDLHIMNYEEEEQHNLLSLVGLRGVRWSQLMAGLAAVITLVLGALALWMMRPAAGAREPAVVWFDRFCKRLAGAGVHREAWEGPLDFSTRAAKTFPSAAESILKVGEIYAHHRYGRNGASVDDLAQAVKAIGVLEPAESETKEVESPDRV